MGATSIWYVVGHYDTVTCPIVVQASILEVVGWGVVVLRLLERSLGGAEIVGWITTWSNTCNQLGILGLLRLLTDIVHL